MASVYKQDDSMLVQIAIFKTEGAIQNSCINFQLI